VFLDQAKKYSSSLFFRSGFFYFLTGNRLLSLFTQGDKEYSFAKNSLIYFASV